MPKEHDASSEALQTALGMCSHKESMEMHEVVMEIVAQSAPRGHEGAIAVLSSCLQDSESLASCKTLTTLKTLCDLSPSGHEVALAGILACLGSRDIEIR